MSDNKKYYYMRLKDDFFNSDSISLIESMQDGYLYSNILLKLYLKSLKGNGRLMFNDRIPYNPQMIATVTRHQVGVVEKALSIFVEIGLVEILENGAMYMLDIQNYIGKSTTEADRKRAADRRMRDEKTSFGEISEKCVPEIEIEIEIEKDIELELETDTDIKPRKRGSVSKKQHGEYKHVLLTDAEVEKLINDYGSLYGRMVQILDEYIEVSGKKYKNHNLVMRKWVAERAKEESKVTTSGNDSFERMWQGVNLDD